MGFLTEWWWLPLAILLAIIAVRVFRAPYLLAKEDAAQRAADEDAGPNLYIFDAFTLIDPDAGNEERLTNYEWHGSSIRDWLSAGEIRSWGRRTRGRRQPSTLTPIPAKYWENADFTYDFMTGSSLVHAKSSPRKAGIPSYAEIMFNRAEFQRLMKLRGYQ